MIGWSPRNLVIDRFTLDYESTETNGLVWIDDLETSSGKSLVDRRQPDHHKRYIQNYLRKFGERNAESNALVARPEAGRAFCRQAILQYIQSTALADHYRQSAAWRQALKQAIYDRLAAT